MLQDGALPTVKINDPHKKRDYVTINESDFDPAIHTKFVEGGAALPKATRPVAPLAPPAVDGLPAGYALLTQPGGRRKVTVNGQTLKHAEGKKAGEDVSFKNEAEAIAAAQQHAAAVAE